MTARSFSPDVNFAPKSLGRRLLYVLLGSLGVSSLAFLILFVGIYRNSLVHEHARASQQLNKMLQATLENAMLKRDIPGLQEIIKNLGQQREIAGVMILNPAGAIRFSSDPSLIGHDFSEMPSAAGINYLEPGTSYLKNQQDTEVVRTINPVLNKPACSGCHGTVAAHPVNGVLVVDYRANDITVEARKTALALALSGLLVSGLALLAVAFFFYRAVLRPVRQLSLATDRFAEGELTARVVLPRGQDDIARLGQHFNDMAEEIAKSFVKLRNSENFLQSVIDAIPDGIRVVGDDYKILMVNKAYCALHGLDLGGTVGAKCYATSHHLSEPCSHTLVTCPLVELREKDKVTMKTQHRHLRSDGSELFVEVSAARIMLTIDGQEKLCIVESVRDLAEQAQLSQERRLSELGQLATGIAHEIYNPLSSIQLALREIFGDRSAVANPDTVLYLETVDREIERCITMTNRLLRLSEISSANISLLTVEDTLRDVIALINFQAEQAKVKISFAGPGETRIIGNESDLGLLALNLMQNAIHAMPQGGEIKVSVSLTEGQDVVIVVEDQGVGISADNLQKIFWPFWSKRADGSHGTGLGLSISRATVERMGGTITVSSMPGVGTVFTVTLPSAQKKQMNDDQDS